MILINKKDITIIFIFTIMWVILAESVAPIFVISGVITAVVVLLFCKKLLPLKEIQDINFSKLLHYPFFLIKEIYVAGFYIISIVFSKEGSRADIVSVKSKIKNEMLKIMLLDSVTLTPGTIFVEMDGEDIKLLWLRKKNDKDPSEIENLDEMLIGPLQRELIKAQK